jgi:phosphatidylglycerophosphatase A
LKKVRYFSTFLATWFKTGLLKPIPPFNGMAGTYGSFFAIPFCYLVLILTRSLIFKAVPTNIGKLSVYFFFLSVIFLFGLLTIAIAEEELGPQTDWKGKTKTRDQNQIVIDEVLGMLVSCIPFLFVSKMEIIHFVIVFILFRFFDIIKIWPTNLFDNIKNPIGVMLDDVMAGIYAAACLTILILYVL